MLLGFGAAWLLGVWPGRISVPIKPMPRETVTLSFSATIDGSERFIFTRDHVWNEHGQWDPPSRVMFNGTPWTDLSQPPPGWTEFVDGLDLAGARLATREGRDVIALETTEKGFELLFADTFMGAGKYAVTIEIPRK